MRVIIEVFGKAWAVSLNRVHMELSGESQVSGQFEEAPVDPHSVGGCLLEHSNQGALEVQELSGAGMYPSGRRFGFRGRQN